MLVCKKIFKYFRFGLLAALLVLALFLTGYYFYVKDLIKKEDAAMACTKYSDPIQIKLGEHLLYVPIDLQAEFDKDWLNTNWKDPLTNREFIDEKGMRRGSGPCWDDSQPPLHFPKGSLFFNLGGLIGTHDYDDRFKRALADYNFLTYAYYIILFTNSKEARNFAGIHPHLYEQEKKAGRITVTYPAKNWIQEFYVDGKISGFHDYYALREINGKRSAMILCDDRTKPMDIGSCHAGVKLSSGMFADVKFARRRKFHPNATNPLDDPFIPEEHFVDMIVQLDNFVEWLHVKENKDILTKEKYHAVQTE